MTDYAQGGHIPGPELTLRVETDTPCPDCGATRVRIAGGPVEHLIQRADRSLERAREVIRCAAKEAQR